MRFVNTIVPGIVLAAISSVLVAVPGLAQETPPSPTARVPQISVPTPEAPSIDAKSWVLMDDASGRILASKNPNERVKPASITKIMTDYVVSAELANGKVKLDDPVFISEHAWRAGGAGTDGSTSFLKVNSKVPLKDLLYGMIIQSGNDSAIALAEHIAGSEKAFAQLMNAYARRLGMSGTHYMNASGYPAEDHYTTARDVAVLSRALIHDFPEDYAISGVKQFEWNGITQHNRNTLLWRDSSVDGIKTGHTHAAGYCLAASAKRGEQRMIAIVMGASTEKARANDAQALLNYGFRFYETHKLYKAGETLASPELWKGEAEKLPLGVSEDVLVTVPRGQYDKLKARMQLPPTLIAPFSKGQTVGTLEVTLDGKSLLKRPLVSLQAAPEGGFFSRMVDSAMLMFKSDDKPASGDGK